jgi:hypothetical protein
MRAISRSPRLVGVLALLALGLLCPPTATARQGPANLPGADSLDVAAREAFLSTARIVSEKSPPKGTTNTRRVTLTDGTLTHDASVQTIEVSKPVFAAPGGAELNFRDDWRFNVAAYRLSRLLDLNMVPTTVERLYQAKPGSFTWWVDDVLMDEQERIRQKKPVPDALDWNQQMWTTRMFDQLIANVDRNQGNLLIDRGFNVWMIDHSRSFRLNKSLRNPENLAKADRRTLDRLRQLDKPTLVQAVGAYLKEAEIDALLDRRDQIVAFFDKGGPLMLFDLRPR